MKQVNSLVSVEAMLILDYRIRFLPGSIYDIINCKVSNYFSTIALNTSIWLIVSSHVLILLY